MAAQAWQVRLRVRTNWQASYWSAIARAKARAIAHTKLDSRLCRCSRKREC